MKKSLIFILGVLIASISYSQEQEAKKDTSYWKKGGFVGLTFSNVALSQSWSAGGSDNTTLNGAVSLFADFKKKRTTWESTLDMGYGLIRQGEFDEKVPFEKSDDKINFVTKWGYKIKNQNEQWYFSGLLDYRTQFDEGLNGDGDLISQFMAPGYLTVGLGIDYKPSQKVSFNYIPLTGKMTFVFNDSLSNIGAFGVDSTKNFRAELGSFLRIKYKDEIFKNVSLDTRLELFSNYIEDFGTIDVNWQNTLVMKVNSFLSANWYSQLIYDRDIKTTKDDGSVGEAKIQLKSVFGVGITYKFGDERKKK